MRIFATLSLIAVLFGGAAIVGLPAYFSMRGVEPPILPAPGISVALRDGSHINVIDVHDRSREARGETADPAIVLIHGLPGSGYDWNPLHTELAGSARRVIAYDRKGYGHSASRSADEIHSVDANASELLQLLEKFDLRDVTLVGWSYGGGIAIRAAAIDSSRIGGVVLLASIGPLGPHSSGLIEGVIFSEPVLAWIARIDPLSRATTTALSREAFSGQAMPDWWVPQTRANLAGAGARRALVREGIEWPTVDLDPKPLEVPILVIHGSDDRSVPIAVGEDLYEQAGPGSQILRVDGGSHMLPITHPELLAERIQGFSRNRASSRD
jgi:non-heme chloroperoxidase